MIEVCAGIGVVSAFCALDLLRSRGVTPGRPIGVPAADGPYVEWVRATEVDRFGVPAPDHQILVRVPEAVAADRVRSRAAAHADRAPDGYETDADLQRRCAAVYDGLMTRCWLAPWSVLTPSPQGFVRTADKMVTEWIRGRFASGSSVRSDTIET